MNELLLRDLHPKMDKPPTPLVMHRSGFGFFGYSKVDLRLVRGLHFGAADHLSRASRTLCP
jgi:hypothetical protein